MKVSMDFSCPSPVQKSSKSDFTRTFANWPFSTSNFNSWKKVALSSIQSLESHTCRDSQYLWHSPCQGGVLRGEWSSSLNTIPKLPLLDLRAPENECHPFCSEKQLLSHCRSVGGCSISSCSVGSSSVLGRLQAAPGNWCVSVSPVGSTDPPFVPPDRRHPILLWMRRSPLLGRSALSEGVCHCIFLSPLSTKPNLSSCRGSHPAVPRMPGPFSGLLLSLSRYLKCIGAGRIAGCAATIIPNSWASCLTDPDAWCLILLAALCRDLKLDWIGLDLNSYFTWGGL